MIAGTLSNYSINYQITGLLDYPLQGSARQFGGNPIDETASRAQLRMRLHQRLRNVVGLEQEIFPFVWRRLIGKPPQIALRPVDIVQREANQRQAASLAAILVWIAPLSFLVG